MDEEEGGEKKLEQQKQHCFAVYRIADGLCSVIDTDLPSPAETELQTVLNQKLEKGLIFNGQGVVFSAYLGLCEDKEKKSTCFYRLSDNTDQSHQGAGDGEEAETYKYLVCFISVHEEALDLFRGDLDKHSAYVLKDLQGKYVEKLEDSTLSHLERWYSTAIQYLTRSVALLEGSARYLVYSALLDVDISVSGGTTGQQSDINSLYHACSLSDILEQLKEVKHKHETGSETGSMDLLLDLGTEENQTKSPSKPTLKVNITEDQIEVDSTDCTQFCEDWGNALNRPEWRTSPAKLKQVIEAFKLKFIQTMNTLKRLLREAEKDYYALYRSFVFLNECGNSEILLHYVNFETDPGTLDVLNVLQDFLKDVET